VRRGSLRHAAAIAVAGAALVLAACGGVPARPDRSELPRKPGGYYLDDGPHANPPADLDQVPDAQPRVEPIKASTARPYTALGRSYTPMQSLAPYSATGVASWYGKRYHGQPTASGEIYDMYAMTAAHPTLPIPSYVRVTDLASGKSVVVRINDRGPFHADRVIDLSYTAAYKLGIVANGGATVRVDSILPQQMQPVAANVAAAATRVEPALTVAPPAPSPTATAPASVDAQRVEAVPAAAPAAAASPLPGIYLQLGAFTAFDNAQAFLRRMRAEMSWLADNGGVFASGGLYRVQAGPYATRDQALQAAGSIERTLDLQPLIVTR